MAKPRPARESAFEEEESPIPFISATGVNEIYEKGFSGLPDSVYEDPSQKRIEELEDQLANILQGQSNGLVVQDGALMVQGFQFSPTGLVAHGEIDKESWTSIGGLIHRLQGSIQWLIGDWIVYGQTLKYGELEDIAESVGYKPQSVYKYSYVSRNVEFCIRMQNLSWAHHQLVAPLTPEQQKFALEHATTQKLSVAKFRDWINEQTGQPAAPALPHSVGQGAKSAFSSLEKLAQRDPSTYKPKDKVAILGYAAQMQAWIDDLVAKAKS
jgi:hypothetical protein